MVEERDFWTDDIELTSRTFDTLFLVKISSFPLLLVGIAGGEVCSVKEGRSVMQHPKCVSRPITVSRVLRLHVFPV